MSETTDTIEDAKGVGHQPLVLPSFTPGPWAFVDGIDEGDKAIKSKSGYWVCLCFNEQPSRADCEKNGALIAAAPDMLATLQDIKEALEEDADYGQRVCEWNFEGGTPLEMVEWAIAKALGQNAELTRPEAGTTEKQ